MTTTWYCVIQGEEKGPFSGRQLKQLAANGKLTPTDKIRQHDSDQWVLAKRVKGLFASKPQTTTASQDAAIQPEARPSGTDAELTLAAASPRPAAMAATASSTGSQPQAAGMREQMALAETNTDSGWRHKLSIAAWILVMILFVFGARYIMRRFELSQRDISDWNQDESWRTSYDAYKQRMRYVETPPAGPLEWRAKFVAINGRKIQLSIDPPGIEAIECMEEDVAEWRRMTPGSRVRFRGNLYASGLRLSTLQYGERKTIDQTKWLIARAEIVHAGDPNFEEYNAELAKRREVARQRNVLREITLRAGRDPIDPLPAEKELTEILDDLLIEQSEAAANSWSMTYQANMRVFGACLLLLRHDKDRWGETVEDAVLQVLSAMLMNDCTRSNYSSLHSLVGRLQLPQLSERLLQVAEQEAEQSNASALEKADSEDRLTKLDAYAGILAGLAQTDLDLAMEIVSQPKLAQRLEGSQVRVLVGAFAKTEPNSARSVEFYKLVRDTYQAETFRDNWIRSYAVSKLEESLADQ